MKLNTLIVDDDPMSRKVLARLVEKNEFLELIDTVESADSASEVLKSNHINLLFLDIIMPSMTGLEFINTLREKPHIILTSSHKDYALQAFDYNVDDYLVKPVREERFDKAVNKVVELFRTEHNMPVNFEEYMIGKSLKYLYSRGREMLNPVRNRNSKIGYSYPIISVHYDHDDEHKVLDVLNHAHNEDLLFSQFHEIAYLCPNCYEGFVLYREVCPKCTSSNLYSEDLVHHFPCAYIGPLSDFVDEAKPNELQCPKCDRTLRHIGVDYDKPSLIFHCNNCDHKFQDVFVKAKCLSCGTDSEVENLNRRRVQSYEMTNKGEEAAKVGYAPSSREGELKIPGTVDMETFNLMLKYEVKRKEIAEFQSNIGYINLANRYQLLRLDRATRQKMFTGVVEIIQKRIPNLDIIALKNESTIIFSMTEKEPEEAMNELEEIVESVKKYLRKKFKDFKPNINCNIKPIEAHIDPNVQLNELTKSVVSD